MPWTRPTTHGSGKAEQPFLGLADCFPINDAGSWLFGINEALSEMLVGYPDSVYVVFNRQIGKYVRIPLPLTAFHR